MDNSQVYISLASAAKHDKDHPVRLVTKYRGDQNPFSAQVGDYVVNQAKNDVHDNLYLEHGQNVSLSDYNKLLSFNQQPSISMDKIKDSFKTGLPLADGKNNLAIDAPVKNGQLDLQFAQPTQEPFNFPVQKSLENHSKSAHGMVNALTAVNPTSANEIKNDPKFQFGQYDEKVVDDVPAKYFDNHPLPIGQSVSNSQMKSMLFNGHSIVMDSARQKTSQAMENALLADDSADMKPVNPRQNKKKDFSQLYDPLAPENANLREQSSVGPSDGKSVHDDNASLDNEMAPEASISKDHQSFSKALSQQFSQAVKQRYNDHQKFTQGTDDADGSASEFEDDYEPKDFADAESALRFEKMKGKLFGQDDKSTQRTKYLTNLLTTRNAVTQQNDDSLLDEEMSNDNDDVTVNDNSNSDLAKKVRQDKKLKYRQRRLDKQRKQTEMYAESIYAMKYHDDHGNAKFQYNMIPRDRKGNQYINTANYTGDNGRPMQTHSMPINETDFQEIMKANGTSVSPEQVAKSVAKGQAIVGKHDNIAFSAQVKPSQYGTKLKANSIGPTATDFDYHKEIESKAAQAAKPSPGLVKNAVKQPTKFGLQDLFNPNQVDKSVQSAHQSFSAAMAASLKDLGKSNTNHKQATKVAQQPSLG